MRNQSDVTVLLAKLRDAADVVKTSFPETTWKLVSAEATTEHKLTRNGALEGLALAPGRAFHVRCRLHLPADAAGVRLFGDPLEATVFSLYPAQLTWEGRQVFQEEGVPVAAGPALVTVIPTLREGDNGTLDLVLRVPPNQVSNWFQLRLTTRGIRMRFEKLDTLWAQLSLARALAIGDQQEIVGRAAELVPQVLEAGSDAALASLCADADQLLAPLLRDSLIPKVHLIGHCHIDMNWLWTWPDTVEVIRRDFRSVLQLMADYPELTFSHSQPAVYEVIRQIEPAMFDQVKAHIRTGRWEATTLQWVESDGNMPSGEAHVRQLLEGVTYTRELLGVDPVTFHAPDTFGHPGNLPQLSASAGARFYYHHRCNPGGTQQWPAYWWEGQDGTRLLAFSTPSYNGEITAGDLANASLRAIAAGLPCGVHFHGIGDHGGGPARQNLDALRRLQTRPFLPTAVCSTMAAYAREIIESGAALPVHRGELNNIFEGCYTTHADTKRYNRAGENLLTTADTLAALAGENDDHATVDAWRKVLFNQFHDILDGSAIHESYDGNASDFVDVSRVGNQVIDESLRVLQSHVPEGVIAVTNPLGIDREDWVMVPGDWKDKGVAVESDAGHLTTAQVSAEGLGFVARVPAFGTTAYQFRRAEAPDARTGVTVTPAYAPGDNRSDNFLGDAAKLAPYLRIDTPFFRVYLRRDCGVFVSFTDKRVGRELVGYGLRRGSDYIDTARPDLGLNVLQLFDERPHGMSAWQMHEIHHEHSLLEGASTTVSESGPARAVIDVNHKVRRSTITQRISFYRDLPRVDFQTGVDWNEVGGNEAGVPGLKVSFNARLHECEAWYETPFAAVRRPADGQENPALRWADVGGEQYGIAVLNDCKYGHDILGTRLRMTLLRSGYDPDAISDVGHHDIRYSLFPHVGDWRSAAVAATAAGFNQPLLATVKAASSVPSPVGPRLFQPRLSGSEGIMIASLKPGRNGGRLVRLFDSDGCGGEVLLQGLPPAARIEEASVTEDSLLAIENENGSARLSFRPWQVRTIRVLDSS